MLDVITWLLLFSGGTSPKLITKEGDVSHLCQHCETETTTVTLLPFFYVIIITSSKEVHLLMFTFLNNYRRNYL